MRAARLFAAQAGGAAASGGVAKGCRVKSLRRSFRYAPNSEFVSAGMVILVVSIP